MRVIGVITNDQNRVFQRSVIAGIRTIAAEANCEIVIDSRADADSRRLQPDDADGFLVIANVAPREFLEAALRQKKPVSFISHHMPDLPFPAVVFNNRQGIMELVRHISVECRRNQIVFVRGISDQYDARQREAAFKDALMRYHVPSSGMIAGEFDPEKAIQSLMNYINEGNRFSAVIASDYMMARALVDVLREMGYDVPGEITVVGFGDGIEAHAAGLTTVAADVQELGERAARQLIHQMHGETIVGVTTLSVRLIVRDTSFAPQKTNFPSKGVKRR